MNPETALSPSTVVLPTDAALGPHEPGSDGPVPSRFSRAPQSVVGFMATVLDPVVIVLTLLGLHLLHEEPFGRWATALSLMVIALTFPGRLRIDRRPLALAIDIAANWAALLFILLLCVYVTRSIGDLDWPLVMQWIVVTPVVHWLFASSLGAVVRRLARSDQSIRPAVIIGAGALALRTAQAIERLEGPRRRIVGYFDDRADTRIAANVRELRLGRLDEAARYVDKLGIREVYITLPMASQSRFVVLLDALQGTTASLYFVPDIVGTHIVQGRLQDVNGLPVVGICESPFTGINDFVKRLSDFVFALSVLVVCLPLMAMIALAIRLDSRGPVLYRQRRNGLDGDEIIVFKFRTMVIPDDGRRIRPDAGGDLQSTRIGAFLRRWSLDGLPQFFNVLQGCMSIVGPRPHAVRQNTLYRHLIKGYMVRHKARPGITGWAQIHGQRGDTDSGTDALESMRLRLAYDLAYLRNWSLGLDLRIMARTLKAILTGDARAL